MRFTDFEAMVRRMATEVPREYLDGVDAIDVERRALPHPTRAEIYTLGECIPLPDAGDGPPRSRVVLYHGSFERLARLDDGAPFDWRGEAWETLTHELRHHLEWRAGRPDLEAFDRAAEHNFARHDGDRFDPAFYLDGDSPVPGVYVIDDDYFLDHVVRSLPLVADFVWHGTPYRADVPTGATLPAFLSIDGLDEPPPGELVLCFRRKPRLWDLVRERIVWQGRAVATRR